MKHNSVSQIGQQKTALGGVVKVDPNRRVVDMTAAELVEIIDSRFEEFHDSGPKATDDGYADRAGIAKFLDVSPGQVDKLCRDQGLPFHRVGDVKRFDRDEIRAWVKAQAAK